MVPSGMQRVQDLCPFGQFNPALDLSHKTEVMADLRQYFRIVRIEIKRSLNFCFKFPDVFSKVVNDCQPAMGISTLRVKLDCLQSSF